VSLLSDQLKSPMNSLSRCAVSGRCQGFPRVVILLAMFSVGCTSGNEDSNSPKDAISSEVVDRIGSTESEFGEVQTAAAFVDVSRSSAIEFTYRNGREAGQYSILELLGGGVGMSDYDNDGDIDLFFPGGGQFKSKTEIIGLSSGLFRNEGSWQMTDRALESRIDVPLQYSHGAAVGDFDNDGFADVLVTGYGGLTLFHNQGDGTYRNDTRIAGLSDSLWSSSAAWGDLNGDGNADLYVAHYVDWSPVNNPVCPGPQPVGRDVCPPRRFEPLPDVLFVSNGDGTFFDASATAPLRKDGKGLGVLMADVDLDGHVDVYVANDNVANFLYRNTGDGHLEDASSRSGTSLSDLGTPDGSMGVDAGDYNLDGRPDIWVSNYERESFALYRNEGNFFFQHVSRMTGVTSVGGLAVGWGTVFFDFDRDGDEDVFVSNGHVIYYPTNVPLRQPPLLFQNESGTSFRNVATQAGPYLRTPHMGRGTAVGDLDNDGDQDLAISLINEPVAVLSNQSGANHSLVVRLIGTHCSRDAVGALVRVQVTDDAPVMIRLVKSGGSYASSSDPRLYFGLGQATSVRRVEVRWPSGVTEILEEVDAQEILVLREPR
jgi:hypothetical protein